MVRQDPIYVYVAKQYPPILAGVLDYDEAARTSTFRYVRSYLDNDTLPPIAPGPQFAKSAKLIRTTDIHEGLPGVVRDALPDYWGRLVYASAIEKPVGEISSRDMLLADLGERPGFLLFGARPEWNDIRERFSVPTAPDLGMILDAAEIIARDGHIPPELRPVGRLLLQGSSMGGARPKTTLLHDGALWIAKFPAQSDMVDVPAVEQATAILARSAGIHNPETRLITLPDGRHVFLSKRFDRSLGPSGRFQRFGFVSALTLLDLDESENALGSYPSIARLLRQNGHVQAGTELFRRMVFNLLIRNTDDHLRNHAIILGTQGWRLSPAYDINPGIAREGIGTSFDLSIGLGRGGRSATLENARSDLSSFGVSDAEATHIIESCLDAISGWRRVFSDVGMSDRSAEAFRFTFAYGNSTSERRLNPQNQAGMSTGQMFWAQWPTWDAMQKSLEQAGKMLDRAGTLIREEFDRLQVAGKYRMDLDPDMVGKVKNEWVMGLVNLHHEGHLTLPALQKVLAERDQDVRPLMREEDAKVLMALIDHVDSQVVNRMCETVTEHLQKAKIELELAKDARDYLKSYRGRVFEAYTMGLGHEYGQAQEHWKFPDLAGSWPSEEHGALPDRKNGGRKP